MKAANPFIALTLLLNKEFDDLDSDLLEVPARNFYQKHLLY
jgi:hypothetical protein